MVHPLFNIFILKTHCRPGLVLGSGDPAVNKVPALLEFKFLCGVRVNKDIIGQEAAGYMLQRKTKQVKGTERLRGLL